MEETHNLKGMSLIPSARYWMDIVSRKFVLRFLLFVWKRPKLNEKKAEDGSFLV